MKKILALTMALGLVLTGCSNNEQGFNETPNGERAAKSMGINLPTAATTGALYPLGSSIATLWNEKLPYVNTSAQASNGGIENLNLLQSGEAQVSMAVISNVYQSMTGIEKFDGRPNEDIRVIAGLYYNPNQVVVRGDAPVQKLSDLAGKSFATGAPGSTTEDESRLHLTAAGIAYPDGIKAQFIGFTEAVDLMRNKQLDGAWIMAGIPTAAVTEITSTAGGRVIPIDQEIIDKLKADYPWYAEYTIPANTYKDQTTDIKTTAIKMAMFTSAQMPEDVVYDLTKTFWENIEQLKQSNPALKDVSIEKAVTDIADVPLHKGAIKYYKEVGVLK